MQDITTMIETKFLTMSRFKSVLKVGKKTCYFEEVEEIDWDYHVSIAFENEVITEAELLSYIGKLHETELDVTKPLWSELHSYFLLLTSS